MRTIALLAMLAGAALAQEKAADLFNKPPADVDRALRARIDEFYQDHVKGEFRKAEALVAEDTKDYFYAGNKPHYLSFELVSIKYSDDFRRAEAVVKCEQRIPFPEFGGKAMVFPIPSYWKLENGEWYWYVDKDRMNDSPFGHMTPGPYPDQTGKPATLPTIATSVQQFYSMVKADKNEVKLAPGGSAEVTISNSSPGPVTLAARSTTPGIEVHIDQAQIKASDRAVVTIHAGDGATSGSVEVRVLPIGQVITVKTTVQ
ncbi:MAG: hypothetical protein ACLQVN_19225 [Bryobacteraceae bacterium]